MQIVEAHINMALDVVRMYFEVNLAKNYIYHSFSHTLEVCQNAKHIGLKEELSVKDCNLAQLAAIMHDTGYVKGSKNHELRSAQFASQYMLSQGFNQESIGLVRQAILATQIPQHPDNKLSSVVCDADLMYLAADDFFTQAELLRQEWNQTGQRNYEPDHFMKISHKFFEDHNYHTNYGKEMLTSGKLRNQKKINQMIQDLDLR